MRSRPIKNDQTPRKQYESTYNFGRIFLGIDLRMEKGMKSVLIRFLIMVSQARK
jgi:hypothetical protein